MRLTCIGLMSGTSLDGVDGVLVDISNTEQGVRLQQRAFASMPMPAALRSALWALQTPADNELHQAALAANALMQLYADCVQQLLAQAGVARQQVAVIGAH